MRKLLALFALFFVSPSLFAATSAVTATITDADSQTWNNGSFQVTFVPLPGTSASIYNVAGASFTQFFTGLMNGSGVLSVTLTDLSTVSPTGGQWRFTLCPNASAACSSVVTNAVVGATPNLSTQLSTGLAGPRFATGPASFGYSDTEISPTPQPGGIYFSVTVGSPRVWNGASWTTIAAGGGTINANNTAAGAVANYPAASGSTTVGPTTLNYVAPTLTVSTAGGGNAVVALSGNTSGTATLTAPAVASTTTNALVSSNVISAPAGTSSNVTYASSAAANTGTNIDAGGDACLETTGNYGVCVTGGANVQTGSSQAFTWSATGLPTGANAASFDTALSRPAAGMISADTSAKGNELALFRLGVLPCRVSADITLSTSATNLCSWSLPAVAKTWAWQCQILWAVTAGTTPTISIGANPSQTPTGTTNGAATILTTNADVGTEGSAAISASGTTTLLTSGTLTTSATVFQAASFGTLLASGTAGTFAINMTGTGASFAGTAKAGTTCWLY